MYGDEAEKAEKVRKAAVIKKFVEAKDVATIGALLNDGSIEDLDVMEPLSDLNCLHNSAWHGLLDNIRFLLNHEKKANINKQNKDGQTPLMRAVYNNQPDACKVLIDYKADKSLRTTKRNGNQPFKTALDIAKFCGHRECAHIIEKYDPNQKQKLNNKPSDADAPSGGAKSSSAAAPHNAPIALKKATNNSFFSERTAKKIIILAIIILLVSIIVQNLRKFGDEPRSS